METQSGNDIQRVIEMLDALPEALQQSMEETILMRNAEAKGHITQTEKVGLALDGKAELVENIIKQLITHE